jgi:hypothetical protein
MSPAVYSHTHTGASLLRQYNSIHPFSWFAAIYSIPLHHEKLSPFGFEIYAAIDAYSRCIIWIYVGVSGRVSLSIVQQFLLVILEKGYTRVFHISYDLIEEKRHHLQLKSTLLFLVQCKTTLNSNFEIVGIMEQVQQTGVLNHGGLDYRSRSCTAGE